VGSNPTPRASNVGSTKTNKNKRTEIVFRTNNKKEMTLHSQIRISSSNDIEQLERKIDSLTKSLSKPYFNKILKELLKKNLENANIICDYIIAEQTEINIKDSTKEGKIKILIWLSNHFQDKKSYRNMIKHDIIEYLNTLRRSPIEDPTQKWIGSYNGRQMILNKFFRWLYNPYQSDHKQRETPECMQGIKKLFRKNNTSYKPAANNASISHGDGTFSNSVKFGFVKKDSNKNSSFVNQTFECSIDGSNYTKCNSPYTINILNVIVPIP
jgi:hypothetical protein